MSTAMNEIPQQAGDPGLRVALLFPGQGAQHPRMAAGLYDHDEVFTTAMDDAFEHLGSDDGPRTRGEWLAEHPSPAYNDVTVAQPLLYAVNHALGRMVMSWGVRPVAVLGHSVGEMVAATLAGVLSLSDGAALMRARIQQFARTPAGGMLAVAASVGDVDDLIGEDVFLAAVNAPRQILLAGEVAPLSHAADELRARGLVCRDAAAKQAFHSPVVAGAVQESQQDWARAALRTPRMKLYSAYTEGVLSRDEALDPGFWARQPAETVKFAPTLDQLLSDQECLLLEAGPGRSLSTLARRHPAVRNGRSRVISLLPERHRGDEADRESVTEAAAELSRYMITGPVPVPTDGGRP